MSVLVAVSESPEGVAALTAGAAEAQLLDTDLVVVNLSVSKLDTSTVPSGVDVEVVDRHGVADRDPVEVVLDEIRDRAVQRLVIGLRRRSPVGKALLGSISQRLLIDAPVPVLAVKLRQGQGD